MRSPDSLPHAPAGFWSRLHELDELLHAEAHSREGGWFHHKAHDNWARIEPIDYGSDQDSDLDSYAANRLMAVEWSGKDG